MNRRGRITAPLNGCYSGVCCYRSPLHLSPRCRRRTRRLQSRSKVYKPRVPHRENAERQRKWMTLKYIGQSPAFNHNSQSSFCGHRHSSSFQRPRQIREQIHSRTRRKCAGNKWNQTKLGADPEQRRNCEETHSLVRWGKNCSDTECHLDCKNVSMQISWFHRSLHFDCIFFPSRSIFELCWTVEF